MIKMGCEFFRKKVYERLRQYIENKDIKRQGIKICMVPKKKNLMGSNKNQTSRGKLSTEKIEENVSFKASEEKL